MNTMQSLIFEEWGKTAYNIASADVSWKNYIEVQYDKYLLGLLQYRV